MGSLVDHYFSQKSIILVSNHKISHPPFDGFEKTVLFLAERGR